MTRFPAEWESQSAVLIAWPNADGDFSRYLSDVEQAYRFIAQTIAEHQQLIIVVKNDEHQRHIQHFIEASANISYIQADVNDIWVRDTVFLTVEEDGITRLCNFRFNGWGGKYAHELDNALNQRLLDSALFQDIAHQHYDFVLEGGSVESDGAGTVLTTKQCLLNSNRNPRYQQAEIEQLLLRALGATRLLWLDQPNLSGDDTDAHIDTLARFCSIDTIAYTSCDDEDDDHYASLKAMAAQLQALRTEQGQAYKLVPLPMPKPIYDPDGRRLPANYANFLLINNAVMVPVYQDSNDEVALKRLAECFPDRKIIATPCRPIVHQYGSLHCMTMQFPAAVFNPQTFKV